MKTETRQKILGFLSKKTEPTLAPTIARETKLSELTVVRSLAFLALEGVVRVQHEVLEHGGLVRPQL